MAATRPVLVVGLLACALAACGKQPPAPAAQPAVAPAPPPAPDPRAEVHAALARLLAARSFHATMRIEGGAQGLVINEVDFVAPDRYRMRMADVGTQTIIGDAMYLSMRGRTTRVPMPAGTLTRWRDPAMVAGNEATMTVQAQGDDRVGTEPARRFLVHHAQPQPVDVLLWIGANGLPAQLQVSSNMQGHPVATTIRYSRFDDPTIRIEPPK